MSNHFSAANLKFPGDDARLDLTDLFDDVFSARFAWLTHGKVTSDGLKPHDDLLDEFPYLGPPNVYPAG